jgi:hypothetical protein
MSVEFIFSLNPLCLRVREGVRVCEGMGCGGIHESEAIAFFLSRLVVDSTFQRREQLRMSG